MKYKAGNFFQVSREAMERLRGAGASTSERVLYTTLVELEHVYTSSKKGFFYRTVEDLAADTNLSRPTVIRGLRFLSKIGLLETWQAHFEGNSPGKKSKKHVTAIQLLH